MSATAAVVVASFANALWFRTPQGLVEPENIYVLAGSRSADDPSRFSAAALQLFGQLGVFSAVAGQVIPRDAGRDLAVQVTLDRVGRSVEVLGVTASYFQLVGLSPWGRGFVPADDVPGAPGTAVMSYELWQAAYGGDPALVGSTIAAFPEPLVVVGIAPRGFRGAIKGEQVDLWIPAAILPRLASGARNASGPMPMVALVRIPDGVTPGDMNLRFQEAYAVAGRSGDALQFLPIASLFATTQWPLVVIGAQTGITMMAGVATLLLLAACATLSAFLLISYDTRRAEMSIRLALGASPRDIAWLVGQQLLGTAAVAVVGSVGLTALILRSLPTIILPGGIDLARLDYALDWRVLCAAGLAATLVVGASGTVALGLALRRVVNGPRNVQERAPLRRHGWILAAHVAATVVLLFSATTLLRAAERAVSTSTGFADNEVLFVSVHMPSTRGVDASDAAARVDDLTTLTGPLLDRLRALPAVQSVAFGAPPLGRAAAFGLGEPRLVRASNRDVEFVLTPHVVSPEYFETLGMPFTLGQSGNEDDVVVTRAFADQVWPGESPVGQRVAFQQLSGTVAGIVDVAFGSVRWERPSVFFALDARRRLPAMLASRGQLDLAIRSADVADTRRRIEGAVFDLYPQARAVTVVSGRDLVEFDLGRERLAAVFFGGAGAIAGLLALASIAGLTAYVIKARRRDFGIMIALGASSGRIRALAVGVSLKSMIGGIVAALLIFGFVDQALTSTFVGVAGDPWWVAVAPLPFFVAVGTLVALGATEAVKRLDPLEAIRSEQ